MIQLASDIDNQRVTWKDLSNNKDVSLAQQVDNISKESFNNLEENFHEYSGLIYDGAFSEHMTNSNKKGLIGEDIDEEKAKQKVEEILGKASITDIQSFGLSNNANIFVVVPKKII